MRSDVEDVWQLELRDLQAYGDVGIQFGFIDDADSWSKKSSLKRNEYAEDEGDELTTTCSWSVSMSKEYETANDREETVVTKEDNYDCCESLPLKLK